MTARSPLLTDRATDLPPAEYLASQGRVFVHFDQQDSGNVSYGVEVDGTRYFVKTAGDPADDSPSLSFEQRVALLQNARTVAAVCREIQVPGLQLPALHGVVASPCGPLLVYDWVEGELLGGLRPVRELATSAHARFRRLPPAEILSCLDRLYALHTALAKRGWVAVDLYDSCLLYDFATGQLGVVDLDHYHRGPFENTTGRMFGSSRFMAPEEFERGATIDARTTVFTLGRMALVFLSDGTLEPEPFRASAGLHAVAVRACEPDPARRFASVQALESAWRRARSRGPLLAH